MLECVRKEGGKVAAKREQEGKASKRKFQGLRVPMYTIAVIRVRAHPAPSAALFNTNVLK